MEETNESRLSSVKTEGDVRVPEYRKALENAIDTYSINDASFNNNKEEVLKGAIRLLSGYDIDPLFTTIPERNLFAIAVSDAWLSTKSIREKKALLDVLKLVATGEREEKYASLSGRVVIMSEHGVPRGTMFNPEASSGNTHTEYLNMLLKYIEDNTNTHLTNEVSNTLEDWSKNSKLAHVRERLSINSKEDEKQFKVVVLDKTAREMYGDVGYTSLYISRADDFTVVFNCDYQKVDSIEHEYAHSQSEGLTRWYQGLLFRGINEALTEGSKTNPQTYPAQRELLNKILRDHPTYEDLLYKSYVGDEESRTQVFSKIVNDYGLEGFLALARINPIDNPLMSGSIGKAVYIETNQALSITSKNIRE